MSEPVKQPTGTLFMEAMRTFHMGVHIAVAPKRCGVFPVWGRDGGFRGFVEVFEDRGRLCYAFRGRVSPRAEDIHMGWWWSKSLPTLSAAPSWEKLERRRVAARAEARV